MTKKKLVLEIIHVFQRQSISNSNNMQIGWTFNNERTFTTQQRIPHILHLLQVVLNRLFSFFF